MDKLTVTTGELYEQLMLRAFGLLHPNPVVGADRRHYYLLYLIRNGMDLRETGYQNQFLIIRTYIANGIANLLDGELHDHERTDLNKVAGELENIQTEQALGKVINKLLRITQRLSQPIL
ncbi:MAG: hypothetical protein EOP49_04600 [Sphingobacteriales bacterium]|nr:MAG: hypothetical protein EOP49_04600 [Sphingobacteriales bacterium]